MRTQRWVTTTNHKNIGILYLATSFVFFLAAVAMAMPMRTRLIRPDNLSVKPDSVHFEGTYGRGYMLFEEEG